MNMIHRISIVALLIVTASTAHAASNSRYAPLLASTAGQDTLRNLALWEDQRVTNDGALFAYLKEGSPLVQVRAAEVIGRIQDPADAAQLIPFITSKNRPLAREVIFAPVSYTHLRAHETGRNLVCRLLL